MPKLERLTTNVEVATVLGSTPASSDKVESEGRQMKQLNNVHTERKRAVIVLVRL